MNIFYAPPAQISNDLIELRGQEAAHAYKALRYKQGDAISVTDGEGGWYEGVVQFISDDSVRIVIKEKDSAKHPQPNVILGIGIIKKRDRLEFAVEKAVELGVKRVAMFQGENSIKKNVREDRLESIILSAMKQSLRSWLPDVNVYNSLPQLTDLHYTSKIIAAQETENKLIDSSLSKKEGDTLLLVGPEGGFSDNEIKHLKEKKADLVSLGESRLRTETAAITLLNQFHFLTNY